MYATITITPFCYEITAPNRFAMTQSMSRALEIEAEFNSDCAAEYAEEHWENNSHDYKMMEIEELEERETNED